MFQVYFTNMGYALGQQFASLDEAIARGKQACFEFSILRNDPCGNIQHVASWSPIGGLRMYDSTGRAY